LGKTYFYQVAPIYTDLNQGCGRRCIGEVTNEISALVRFTSSTNFSYTGAPQIYTVPAGVTWIGVDLLGAQGGTAGANGYTGGRGGQVTGTIPVTPGETLYVYTGGAGGGVTFDFDGTLSAANTYDAGWNGGGTGNNSYAGGGGGASDIRRNEFTVTNKALTSNIATLTTSLLMRHLMVRSRLHPSHQQRHSRMQRLHRMCPRRRVREQFAAPVRRRIRPH
jgi:hypothetical protein